MATTLGGKAEVTINAITIPASMLSEVSTAFTEGVRTRTTLGGKFNRPSGSLDTAELKFTLYLPSMDYLKNLFPDRYNAPSAPQTAGNVILNADTCVSTSAGPVNVHYTCEDNDDNDVYIYNGLALLDLSMTYNASDDISIPVTIYAEPNVDGNVARLGTGDLTEESIYDADTETTVPVTS